MVLQSLFSWRSPVHLGEIFSLAMSLVPEMMSLFKGHVPHLLGGYATEPRRRANRSDWHASGTAIFLTSDLRKLHNMQVDACCHY